MCLFLKKFCFHEQCFYATVCTLLLVHGSFMMSVPSSKIILPEPVGSRHIGRAGKSRTGDLTFKASSSCIEYTGNFCCFCKSRKEGFGFGKGSCKNSRKTSLCHNELFIAIAFIGKICSIVRLDNNVISDSCCDVFAFLCRMAVR